MGYAVSVGGFLLYGHVKAKAGAQARAAAAAAAAEQKHAKAA
jgi:hypothetical protein